MGAGSAGCVLASRLTENPSATVCLIEAEASDRNFPVNVKSRVPAGGILFRHDRRYNWLYPSDSIAGSALNERRGQKAGTLSGGEQQMLAIGRCLMSEPKLIMFDEPSLGLSPVMVELVFEAIVSLKKSGMSILLIEQNVAELLEIADFAAVLENGSIALSGAAAAVRGDERIQSAYLGL